MQATGQLGFMDLNKLTICLGLLRIVLVYTCCLIQTGLAFVVFHFKLHITIHCCSKVN